MPLSCRVWTILTPFLPDHQDTLLTSCSVYWTLQRVSLLAHTSSATACHTCCMRNCTGSTSQNVSTTNWKSQCIAVCSTRLQVPGRLLYTSLRHSQPTSFTVSHSTSPDRTTLPAQHFRSSGLLCRWSDGLELVENQKFLFPNVGRESPKTPFNSHFLEKVWRYDVYWGKNSTKMSWRDWSRVNSW